MTINFPPHQLTLTDEQEYQARLDRLFAKSCRDDLTESERYKNFKDVINLQNDRGVLFDEDSAAIGTLRPLVISAARKYAKDYSDTVRSVLIIGIEVAAPHHHDLRHPYNNAMECVAWSLSQMESPFDNTFILTFGIEVSCIQVPNKISEYKKVQLELSELSNGLERVQRDSSCASLIRTNHSGALNRGFLRACRAIQNCEKKFFYDGIPAKVFKHRIANDIPIPWAEWEIPQLDLRFKSVESFEVAFSVTYTEDFMRVFSALDQCWEKVQNKIESLIKAMIFRYYGEFVQNKSSSKKPYSLVIGSGFLEELHKSGGLFFERH